MSANVETIIIGGGQAGLSAARFLQQAGREYLVLERADRPGSAWREGRWDSFTLVTPNWSFRLPGGEYDGGDPDGYMPLSEILRRFEHYPIEQRLALEYGVTALAVEDGQPAYRVRTDRGEYLARNVIIATGLFQRPKIPACARSLDAGILQLHSGQYRNPQALPAGAVLVVGSGQSGCQIAEELYQSERKVYLSTGSAGRAPRRYRGRDIYDWLDRSGFLERTPEQLPGPQARFAGNPQLSGKDGGHTLNLHRFFRDGVTLLGRFRDCSPGNFLFAGDLKANLAQMDTVETNILKWIDSYIERERLDVPPETVAQLRDAYAAPDIPAVDLEQAGIGAVIWANGYAFDFSLVKFPVFDSFGFPLTERGATRYPGLYFLGMPWLRTQKGGLLQGIGQEAAHLVERLVQSSRSA